MVVLYPSDASGGRSHRQVWQAGRAFCARPAHRWLRAAVRACAIALLGMTGSACYVYRPVSGPAAAPGLPVAVEINDRGRVALADSLGGSVKRVEGTLQSATDSVVVVRVASVQFMNGQVSRWTNEPVTFRRDLFYDLRERRLSRSRTTLVTIGTVGAAVAFIISRNLFGFGHDQADPFKPPPGEGQ